VDAAISGLRGSEAEVLSRLEQARAAESQADAVSMLAAAVAKSGDVATVQQILTRLADTTTPAWERTALLQGLDTGLPTVGGGRGGRGAGAGAGGRGAAPAVATVALAVEPTSFIKAADAGDEASAIAKRVVAKLTWPGKPATPVVTAVPLTPEQQARFDAGSEVYKNMCVGCHQADGRGREKLAPSLVDSAFVKAPDAGATMRILLAGKEGSIGLMPPLGGGLTDDQIAAVLTYIRRDWGHTGSAVAPDDVKEVRGLTKTRTKPWTDAELQVGRGGRGPGRGGQ
jgi:mono/diheme cytochrome c family protein